MLYSANLPSLKKAPSLLQGLFLWLPHAYILILAIFISQGALIANIDTYNAQRVVQLSIFGVTLAVFPTLTYIFKVDLRLVFALPKRLIIMVAISVFAIFFGALVSTLHAKMPVWALLDFGYWVICLGALWYLVISFRQFTPMRWYYFGVLIVLLMAMFSLRSFIDIVLFTPFSNRIVATPGFANIRLYSDLAVVFMPLSLLVFTRARSPKLIAAFYVFNIYWGWVLLITEARSGILSIGVALLWVACVHGQQGRLILIRCFVTFLSSIFLFVCFPVLSAGRQVRDMTSSSGRFHLWEVSWDQFVDSFPFGVGGMMFAARGAVEPASPHNMIMLLLAEWGALCFFGLLVVGVVVFGRRVVPSQQSSPKSIDVHVVVVLSAIASSVNLLFAGAHIAPFSSIGLLLAYGALLAIYLPAPESGPGSSTYANAISIFLLLMFGVVSILGFELYHLTETLRQECGAFSEYLHPRFWVQGLLECGYH